MSNSILRDKSKDFAKQIVILCRNIKANFKESVLTNQLLRAGTSIGAKPLPTLIEPVYYVLQMGLVVANFLAKKKLYRFYSI